MEHYTALLKAAAVRQLVPGLEVRGGEVGLLQLSLPPASLGSDPLVLVIEDVNIMLGPSRSPRTVAENMVCLNLKCINHSNNFGSRCFCFGAVQRGEKLTFECSCKISWLGLPGLNNLFYVSKTSLNCSLLQRLPKLLL